MPYTILISRIRIIAHIQKQSWMLFPKIGIPKIHGYNINISLVLNLHAKRKQSPWNVLVNNSFFGKGAIRQNKDEDLANKKIAR